ncbi:unnamed protein product [Lymnaea stagnalis]|uniref:Choice-of-anchor I domain-containing protein n=1 Tax=Lymnaea stagnalis TaxID=6523 RepID=A0AAV2HRR0_LYMST
MCVASTSREMVVLRPICSCALLMLVTSYFFTNGLCVVQLSHMSTVHVPNANGSHIRPEHLISAGAVEQIVYDKKENLIYGVGENIIHVISCSNPWNMTLEYSMHVPNSSLTDIEMCGRYLFVTVDNQYNRTQGELRIYKTYIKGSKQPLELLRSFVVGTLPDMLQVTPDCRTVVIAMEAEGFYSEGTFHDPDGAVVIVHFFEGVERAPKVSSLDFKQFNNRYQELLPTGVRFVYRENNNTFSADVEPEFIAFDDSGLKAYVVLQENNAVAEVSLPDQSISAIYGLGYKQWGQLDPSDSDGGIHIEDWPIRAWYLPDGMRFYKWGDRKLAFTANEGDTKVYDKEGMNFDETQRGIDFTDSSVATLSPLLQGALKNNTQLGRLKFSKLDGISANGTYDALYAFGGRSFSIWDTADRFKLLYDSGSDIELTTARYCSHLFNTDSSGVDDKSDEKGPEPESLELGRIGDRLYVFVGNESPGTISVYSIGSDVTTARFETIFCGGITDDGRRVVEKFDKYEVYGIDPEDIRFYDADDSPTGFPVLMVAGSVSGTVSLIKVTVDGESTPGVPTNKDVTKGVSPKTVTTTDAKVDAINSGRKTLDALNVGLALPVTAMILLKLSTA